MSTGIQWTDETWNPLRARHLETGAEGWACVRVSPGCVNCYAATLNVSKRWERGTGEDYTVPGLARVETYLDERTLTQPLRWSKPRRVFVCSMTDLFGEWVTDEEIDRIFAVMALAPQHTFQVLTKRPERMRKYLTDHLPFPGWTYEGGPWREALERVRKAILGMLRLAPVQALNAAAAWHEEHYPDADPSFLPVWPLPNVWLGVSAEDQERADERIPLLLDTPAAVRFVSAEPLLGPIEFREEWLGEVCGECDGEGHHHVRSYAELDAAAAKGIELAAEVDDCDELPCNCCEGSGFHRSGGELDWVIVGGESGPRARPFDVEWARSIVAECRAAGVAPFVKQLGSHVVFDGHQPAGGWWPQGTRDDDWSDYGGRFKRRVRLRHNHGGDWDEWPEDLRVREWPSSRDVERNAL